MNMLSRFCFVFVVFVLTAILIGAVHLRTSNNRAFYRLCTLRAEQNRLRHELWQKQLQLENLLSPGSILQQMDEKQPPRK